MNPPFPVPAWPWAVVEVAADETRERSAELIRAAYRASRSGVVVVALRGITSDAADRLLDDIVDPTDPTFQGVLYLDAADERALLAAGAHAGVVIAVTDTFRRQLDGAGLAAHGADASALVRHVTAGAPATAPDRRV